MNWTSKEHRKQIDEELTHFNESQDVFVEVTGKSLKAVLKQADATEARRVEIQAKLDAVQKRCIELLLENANAPMPTVEEPNRGQVAMVMRARMNELLDLIAYKDGKRG